MKKTKTTTMKTNEDAQKLFVLEVNNKPFVFIQCNTVDKHDNLICREVPGLNGAASFTYDQANDFIISEQLCNVRPVNVYEVIRKGTEQIDQIKDAMRTIDKKSN